MTAVELVASLRARGVTLVPDGDLLRCRPKSGLTEDDLALLRSRKPEILAYLRSAASDTHPVTCFACRSRRFWRSVNGAFTCGVCHPPASHDLVVAWVEAAERRRGIDRGRVRGRSGGTRVEDLPGATPKDLSNIDKLVYTFDARIVSCGPDDSTDGAA